MLAYNLYRMRYEPVKYTGRGCYQRALKDEIYLTYDLNVPGHKGIMDNSTVFINGERLVIRGWQWANRSDLGIFLGAGDGVKLLLEKKAEPFHRILVNYTPDIIVNEKYVFEKTVREREVILEDRTIEEVEIGLRDTRIIADTN